MQTSDYFFANRSGKPTAAAPPASQAKAQDRPMTMRDVMIGIFCALMGFVLRQAFRVLMLARKLNY